MSAFLEELHGHPVFVTQTTPSLVLDNELVIRAANPAYLLATKRSATELLGAYLFEAFPDNDDPHCDGAPQLQQSLDRVRHTRRPHHMVIQRYDIPATGSDTFVERYWTPVNSPIRRGDDMVGLLHQVNDVTTLQEDVRLVLEHYRDLLRADAERGGGRRFEQAAESVAVAVTQRRRLVEEVRHLRRALSSRATIDQATGIVMAERRCDPEQAFGVLVRLSNETNVRVADVAAALVYRANGGNGDILP